MPMSNLFACVAEPQDLGNVDGTRSLVRWINRMPEVIGGRMPPVTLSSVTGFKSPFGETAGFLISPNLTARHYREINNKVVINKLTSSAVKAARLGARIVGLGPVASAACRGGILVARNSRVVVTTGSSIAVAAVLEACLKVLGLNGIKMEEAVVTVIEADDSTAAAAARLLALKGAGKLALVCDNYRRLDALARVIIYESGVSCKISSSVSRAAARADLVVCAKGATAPVDFSCLKPGAVICGLDGAPGLVSLARRVRDDLLVIEGALVTLPGNVRFSHYPGQGINTAAAYAWMAEAMILAMEGRFEGYSLGRALRVGRITEMWDLAARHGFALAGFYGSRPGCPAGFNLLATPGMQS